MMVVMEGDDDAWRGRLDLMPTWVAAGLGLSGHRHWHQHPGIGIGIGWTRWRLAYLEEERVVAAIPRHLFNLVFSTAKNENHKFSETLGDPRTCGDILLFYETMSRM